MNIYLGGLYASHFLQTFTTPDFMMASFTSPSGWMLPVSSSSSLQTLHVKEFHTMTTSQWSRGGSLTQEPIRLGHFLDQ